MSVDMLYVTETDFHCESRTGCFAVEIVGCVVVTDGDAFEEFAVVKLLIEAQREHDVVRIHEIAFMKDGFVERLVFVDIAEVETEIDIDTDIVVEASAWRNGDGEAVSVDDGFGHCACVDGIERHGVVVSGRKAEFEVSVFSAGVCGEAKECREETCDGEKSVPKRRTWNLECHCISFMKERSLKRQAVFIIEGDKRQTPRIAVSAIAALEGAYAIAPDWRPCEAGRLH